MNDKLITFLTALEKAIPCYSICRHSICLGEDEDGQTKLKLRVCSRTDGEHRSLFFEPQDFNLPLDVLVFRARKVLFDYVGPEPSIVFPSPQGNPNNLTA